MAKYMFRVAYTSYADYVVEADSEDEACERMAEMEGSGEITDWYGCTECDDDEEEGWSDDWD